MQCGEKLRLEQIRALLAASQEVRFAGHGRAEVYAWISKTLREQDYGKQARETGSTPEPTTAPEPACLTDSHLGSRTSASLTPGAWRKRNSVYEVN